MALNTQHFRQWDVDRVSQWLETIHLSSLIPTFERLQISGADLPHIDDGFMRERLRVTKPAEVAALKGAIAALLDQGQSSQSKGMPRKSSAPLKTPHYGDRDRSGSFDKPKTFPQGSRKSSNLPTTMPRNYTVAGERMPVVVREPQLKIAASAPEVLDDHCRYSGWIRKQGGGYKNWKKRYLILRIGCLYYFANETASHPKGCFTLSGYKTEYCQEPEITKKFRWTLKLSPLNSALRTYYIAVGAKRELFAWKQAIDEEILACARRRPSDDHAVANNSIAVGEGGEMGEGSSDEEGDDDGPIYDRPDEGDEDYNQDGESPIYDQPDVEDEDDPYSKIEDEGIMRLPSPTRVLPPPVPGAGGPQAGKGGAPTVPVRSAVSLGLDHKQAPAFEQEESQENTYLPIIGSAPSETTADRPKIPSSQHQPRTQTASDDRTTVARSSHEADLDIDYEDDTALEGDDMYPDDSDAYYIMIRKPEELLPPSCVFDRLERADAERLLRAKGRDGTYLIRAGVHAGTEKVLSVWHIDRCRHYKLFKDENSRYSLTQGQTFGTIPELLQYYTLSAHLPRSDFYLSEPYYPQDH